MSKRTVFTIATPLPPGVTRQIVLDFLHDHQEMIDLNPLVRERHPILPPPHASPDERDCQWYSLTDKISYLPRIAGDVTYTCAFHNLPTGLQTHCYAPAGLSTYRPTYLPTSLCRSCIVPRRLMVFQPSAANGPSAAPSPASPRSPSNSASACPRLGSTSARMST